MRKAVVILALLLAPAAVWAQGTLRVLSVRGPVEWKAPSGRSFVPVTATTQQVIQAGDELRTGPDAEIYLELPDRSYVVVSENSKFTVEDYWSGNLRSIINLMVGRARFYIQKLGGRPNPYSVTTPTALIAVRGTVFDVIVYPGLDTEVQCLEGQVRVENIALGLGGRDAILDPGYKTLVRPNENPTMPVRLTAELPNRKATIRLKTEPNGDMNGNGSTDIVAHDNDRRNRISNPPAGPNSGTSDNTQRAKPTLTFP